MKEKIALIASGGGMTCAFTLGAVRALKEKFNFSPDIVIGGSGSIGILAYHCTNQLDAITRIWTNHLSTRKFKNSWRFWKIMDIDYVVDVLVKKKEPINMEKLKDSPIHFLIAATDAHSGKVKFFSNREDIDLYEAMRATSALPVLYGKTVRIQGNEYIDSNNSAAYMGHVRKAISLGATKIIVIEPRHEYDWSSRFKFRPWLISKNKEFRKQYALDETKDIRKVDVFISPKVPHKSTPFNNNLNLIKTTMQQGYDETIKNKELEELLK